MSTALCYTDQSKTFTYRRRTPHTTDLYRIIDRHYESWSATDEFAKYPSYVRKEFEAFLRCGIPEYGFSLVHCELCRTRSMVAFSCKTRGFCSACATKRSIETTDHLSREIFRDTPVRQYVLSVPVALRYWMAWNPGLLNAVHKIVYQELLYFYKQRAIDWGIGEGEFGGISFIHRFSSHLSLNVHFHILIAESSYDAIPEGLMVTYMEAPTPEEIEKLLLTLSQKIIKLLIKRDYLNEDGFLKGDDSCARDFDSQALSKELPKARKIGHGFGLVNENPVVQGLVARVNNFSLHAGVWVGEENKKGLRQLIGYVSRAPVATKRIKIGLDQVLVELKRPWRDGTVMVSYTPHDFMKCLAQIIPTPWTNQIRYFGVFGPNHKLRKLVTASGTKKRKPIPSDYRIPWRELLKRSFNIDRTQCPDCNGHLRVLGIIMEQTVIDKILKSMKISSVPPP